MKELIYIGIGLVVGFLIGRISAKLPSSSKQKYLDQITDYIKSHNEITNNDVERMLSVSDATAERYLDELEKQGKLVQVGKTGKSVIYKKS